ncbi:Aste57867_16570 [Aphanomyces stellatus]|uniref:Aste57867_16558 protein n=1 Tax=Aphanomyces stellatus TaxID=120398 RepID=A0A485L5Y0_9STRA|nr:hypothetical protein As57867_016501 [Aphanomyces stellatus]KAF0692359.1 hypothetical protein As57867_016513 [Aphanomyces stellatus]VFT93331.1 Aste57867_16558 [Aphanomyces stellatus]VFT93343.1 Aste57867_16570 [Aphanomyces stellatus]
MRALYVVGFVFSAVALWAMTSLVPTTTEISIADQGKPSSPILRTLVEKRAMALAFVQEQLHAHPSIPGISLSVVYQNETVIAQGFGTKQFGKADTPVTAHTLFEIGSYSKTFIALGVAKLVDDGLMHWNDPVQMHLPAFELADAYAQKYTTLADLLAMNSVLSGSDGMNPLVFGVHANEHALVRQLPFLATTRTFRQGYAYSNLNYEVLGQVIQHKTNQTWFEFLRTVYLTPLGMRDTIGRAIDAPNVDELASGHFACNDDVIGPYSLLNSSMVAINANFEYVSAGSILSSASDLAKLSHFLLNRGHGILKSPQWIQDMTTGHTVIEGGHVNGWTATGYDLHREGGAVGVGYGLGTIGNIMYGYNYYDKPGGTNSMHMTNGFVPSQGLGVTISDNVASIDGGPLSTLMDRIRTYVVGIFLDRSIDELNAAWETATAKARPPAPVCDAHFFQGQPWGPSVPAAIQSKLAGTYVASASPRFNGNVTLFQDGHDLMLQYGQYVRPLLATNDPTAFTWSLDFAAQTLDVQLQGLNDTKFTLTLMDMTFERTT